MSQFPNQNQFQIKLKKGICNSCGITSFLIEKKFNKELLCPQCFTERIEKTIQKTIIDYKMITPEDRVIVGLSGGKDSITLLHNLNQLSKKKILKSIQALIIDEGIKDYRAKSIKDAKSFCTKFSIPFQVISFKKRVGKTLDEINTFFNKKDNRRYTCNYCATIRRRLLNEGAKELNGNVLAVGHNLTDFSETYLMNFLYNRLKLIGRQYLFKKESEEIRKTYIKKVKPLVQIPEEEIHLYANLKKLNYYPSHCPYREEDPILRKKVLNFIQEMKDPFPEIEYDLFNSFNKLSKKLYEISQESNYQQANICQKCGYPCGTAQLCTYCKLVKTLNE
jgi:uncharacterized protein (TIGR00269 family)